MKNHSCPECGSSSATANGLCAACLLELANSESDGSSVDGHSQNVTFEATRSYTPKNIARSAELQTDSEFGDYTILRRLGRGGMGTVYESRHRPSGRHVALKVLSHALDDRAARSRFLREGRLAASLNHANSVYVFGTEEIENKPAISMELVQGGTLEQRVRSDGPLSAGDAVDSVLQIIGGLEAAEAKGVLHRDIKPANCFVSPDGTVKVGDFGLSISTNSTEELSTTQITQEGSFLGTPAFASPEQLRGEQLDARSDIYSVGVTLFYLLTGKVPFEGKNMIQLLAKVLDRPAGSVCDLNGSVPSELGRIVSKCLEKSPGNRFADYSKLKQALLPFSSSKPEPAMLGQRFLAGLVDHTLLYVLATLASLVLLGTPGIAHDLRFIPLSFGISVSYFVLMETLLGFSVGKYLFGLRVVQDGRHPTWLASLIRASIYVALPSAPTAILATMYAYSANFDWIWSYIPSLLSDAISYSHLWITGLLFVTARRKNGNASVYDLLSGTAVQRVRKVATIEPQSSQENFEPSDQLSKIGEYYLLQKLSNGDNQEGLWLGYDAKLLRRVWIQTYAERVPDLSVVDRQLARPSRLRWLGCQRGKENWDCFEAPTGQLFVEQVAIEQDWQTVEKALGQLANELELARRDGSLPAELSFDRIWIDENGNVKLLPMGWKSDNLAGQCRRSIGTETSDLDCRKFILDLTKYCVEKCRLSPVKRSKGIPIHANQLVPVLEQVASLADVSKTIDGQATGTIVNQSRRTGIALATVGISLLLFLSAALSGIITQTIVAGRPEMSELKRLLVRYENLDWYLEVEDMKTQVVEQKKAIETVIAGKYRNAITDPSIWNSAARRIMITDKEVRIAEQIVSQRERSRPNPSTQEVEAAETILDSSTVPIYVAEISYFHWGSNALHASNFWLQYVWLPSLVTALLFGRGLILFAFDCAFADRYNQPASRLRVFLRMLIPGLPFLIVAAFCFSAYFGDMSKLATGFWMCILPSIAILVAGILRGRFLSDWLAGTYLVPR